ncbi:hypothetical protein [Serratia odorifera]|uniref:Uncharacterized protein n=1 Tax=Serratia odorifera DSM 4582 TaxID=667129 RepID=D4DZP3_SEROD|nr:hypothetical protein [Serratia odorifera]EFE96799.1 hypothetical protein HMPREF0758_1393 [Serratia odorifera DSM 4582]
MFFLLCIKSVRDIPIREALKTVFWPVTTLKTAVSSANMTRFTLGSSEKKVTNYIAPAFRLRQLSGKRRQMAMQRIPKTEAAACQRRFSASFIR